MGWILGVSWEGISCRNLGNPPFDAPDKTHVAGYQLALLQEWPAPN
jgi:hypothetical protein